MGKARKAAWALVLVAGVVGYGAGISSAAGDRSTYPAKVRGCGSYLAEDEAAHVSLAVFERRADGSVRLVYGCERKGW